MSHGIARSFALPLAASLACAVLGTSLEAQYHGHVNIDFEAGTNGVPLDYHGAGCAPGTWNPVSTAFNGSLVDYTNNPSAVTVAISPAPSFAHQTHTFSGGPFGEGAKLYEDFLVVSQNTTITLGGLDSAKSYHVIVYAWTPDEDQAGPFTRTRVGINGGPLLHIGGEYPGSGIEHHNPQTFAIGSAPFTGQTSVVIDVRPTAAGDGVVNGIQLREWNEIFEEDGISSCSPGPWPAQGGGTGPEAITRAYGYTNPATGRHVLAARDMMLVTHDTSPAGGPFHYGVAFYSDNTTSPNTTISTGGLICVGNPLVRLPVYFGERDTLSMRNCVDYTILPGLSPGNDYAFQNWFRIAPASGSSTWTSRRIVLTFE